MVQLRVFDAFPKVDRSYVYKEGDIDPAKVFYCLFALLFLYVHTASMLGVTYKQNFDVDHVIQDTFPINIAIVLKSPCSSLSIVLQDISEDRLLVNELVRATPLEGPAGEEMCEIRGTFAANRVRGQLAIIPQMSWRKMPTFNSSHFIESLYFGEFPAVVSPLQMTQHVFEKPMESRYYLTLIPTTFTPLGLEVDTYHYAVTQSHKEIGEHYRAQPAIYFNYDFDPIKITFMDNRISFLDWLCRAVNILGGAMFATKAIYKVLERKHATNRYSSGLLDSK